VTRRDVERTDGGDAERVARARVQLEKAGLGEREPAWWDQEPAERRARWEQALARLDADG
jgi:hypothetical protein